MTSQEGSEEFRHQHSDGLKAIKLNRYKIAEELRKELPAQNDDAPKALLEDWEKLSDEIARELTMDSVDAEIVFKKALHSLERVQAFRFLIENLLEGVKRDESLNNSVQNYRNLGLFPKAKEDLGVETRKSPWPGNLGVGRFLKKVMKGLKIAALSLIELVINALKAIPRFVELELEPRVGLVGPFPTLTFHFSLKAKATIQELFEIITGAVED